MEQKRSEQSMQHVLDFKCKSTLPVGDKSSALSASPAQDCETFESQGNVILSQTPAKAIEPSRRDQMKDEALDVFDRCKTLIDLLDRMDSSVRLLQLRKKLPIFRNICTQVEVLTKRKFSYYHLAQIKYILPEAVQVEKILVHDEETLCMKPDLKISLLFDALPARSDQAASKALRQVFRDRLLDFYDTHPKHSLLDAFQKLVESQSPKQFGTPPHIEICEQECDIPEATLPEPFNKTAISLPESLPVGSPKISPPTSIELEVLSDSSHLCKSSGKHFSRKIIIPEAEKTQILSSSVPQLSLNSGSENLYSGSSQENNSDVSKSPVAKLMSTTDNLIVETPAQQTPKRVIPVSDDKVVTSIGRARESRQSATKRSLNFLNLNEDASDSNVVLEESKKHGVIHDFCHQSSATKGIHMNEDVVRSPSAVPKKEEEDEDQVVEGGEMSLKSSVKCRQMLVSLPDLFDLVHIIFQSASHPLITKQELVHKIIWNNCDITDRREVEEQLELLEELVPDWICKKLVPGGDIFYSIKKVSDLVSIRERLVEAL